MNEYLQQLGLNEKEIKVYLVLLEFGTQPASVIAKKSDLPRPTVLYICDRLLKINYIRKSQRGRAQYFYADPEDLKKSCLSHLDEQKNVLEKAIPLLQEYKNPFTSAPKVTFFEGIDGCRKVYLMLLESKTEILEFAAHHDLLRLGEDFMNRFIRERSRRKLLLKAICIDTEMHRGYKKKNKPQWRDMKMFTSKNGEFYSSISIFDDKVLLLNLYQDAFGILIQSPQVAQTLKTVHELAWVSRNVS